MISNSFYKLKATNDRPNKERYSTEYDSSKNKWGSSASIKNKLTKGFKNYQEIKDAHAKPCKETHLKTQYKQCTFEPQISIKKNQRSKSRSMKKFIEDQESHSAHKQHRIKQFRTQMTRAEAEQCSNHPSIDKVSRRICTTLNYDKQNVVQRLSKRKVKLQMRDDEDLFSPKILQKSKSLKRSQNITQLLYNDAKRRIGKTQMLEEQRLSKDCQSPKINVNTNRLVSKKIYSEFTELIPENQEKIPIVMAWTVIGQLFNMDFNPNNSETDSNLCIEMLNYLCKDGDEIVSRQRLWQFIEVIIFKNSCETSLFHQKIIQITDQFGHLYTKRVAKPRSQRSPHQYSFMPQTLRSSQKYAQNFRQKMLEAVHEHILNQNTGTLPQQSMKLQDMFLIDHQIRKASLQKKKFEQQEDQLRKCTFKPKTNNNKNLKNLLPPRMTQNLMQRSITNNSRKKLSKISSTKTLQNTANIQSMCSLSQSMIYKSTIKQPKINDNEQFSLKTHQFKSKAETSLQNSICSYKKQNKLSSGNRIDKSRKIHVEVKDLQKSILRNVLGRKHRQFSNSMKQRGYPKQVFNWNQFNLNQKDSIVKQHKKLKGYNCTNKKDICHKKITLR